MSKSAAETGLKEGDYTKYRWNTTGFINRVFGKLLRHRPDDIIKLSYLRDGKTKTVSATLKGKQQ
jgi:S1-C subfamily serine protease